jgi:hypothetical protein
MAARREHVRGSAGHGRSARRGIHDKQGYLMVFMTHNTDIADAWEREGEDPRYFYEFGPNGYALASMPFCTR